MLPPNFLMDDLLSKTKSGSVSVNSEENNDDFSAGTCQKHKKCQLYFTCKTHNVKICRDCTIIQHPPLQCEIISFEDELGGSKQKTLGNLDIQTLKKEKNILDLQDIITNTKSKIQKQKEGIFGFQTKINELQSNVNENELIVRNTDKAIQDCTKNKSNIYKIKKELISSKSMKQINYSIQEAENVIIRSNSMEFTLRRKFKVAPFDSTQDLMNQTPEVIRKVLIGGVNINVSADVNDETRFAQLGVKNGDIHLSALSPCRYPPAPETTVDISSILVKYPSTNSDIYLTLASEEEHLENLGTVYVKLETDDYSQFIKKLCMGTIGPSYKGAIFTGRGDHSLYTEDVARNYTQLPNTLPNIVNMQKGSVYLEKDTALRFCISQPNNLNAYVIGNVIKGLGILEVAWNFPKGSISIKDVGIVLKK
ncbi:unnamed protein product [Meganyctiphanes norvegica]|uniref:Uncharacterized protein n=1 Tax=Meganyctiphanes norvegica TaxID=48144 RepID=A0AAV2SC28_MEGNR